MSGQSGLKSNFRFDFSLLRRGVVLTKQEMNWKSIDRKSLRFAWMEGGTSVKIMWKVMRGWFNNTVIGWSTRSMGQCQFQNWVFGLSSQNLWNYLLKRQVNTNILHVHLYIWGIYFWISQRWHLDNMAFRWRLFFIQSEKNIHVKRQVIFTTNRLKSLSD